VPDDSTNAAKATIFVASSSDVTAKPERLDLEPNVPATIELQFQTIDFAEESVSVQSTCCPSVKIVIEPGANHQLTISTPADVRDREVFAVTVSANDAEGKPLKCREPLEVSLAPDSFSLTSAASSADTLLPEPKHGSAHISLRDWLLPGHGVVIIWGSLAGSKSAQ